MKQLTGLDAAFLAMESPTTTGHVASVQLLDTSTAAGPLTLESFTAAIAPRIDLVPMCRRKLVQVPLGLDNPYWIDDPQFAVEFHVRELALPAPGSMQQLTEQVARLHARPLDRSRPLWEIYLITGLHSGLAAVYTKIHHAAIDGVSGNEILSALLDTSPYGRAVPQRSPRQEAVEPSQLEMLARSLGSLTGHPVRLGRLLSGVAQSTPGVLATASAPGGLPLVDRFVGDAGESDLLGTSPGLRAPATPFNAAITSHRQVAFADVPLAGVKSAKDATGGTVNDVILSLCAGALRRWLLDHDALPESPLVGGVPVSVRTEEQRGALGNRVSMMVTALPTNLSDPLDRLAASSQASAAAKERFDAVPATLLMDAAQIGFPALVDPAFRVAARWKVMERVRPFNVIISNVPGPRVPLYLAGAELVGYYPVSAIADGQGLNITVFSYRDRVFFGLTACPELIPDLDELADAIAAEFTTLTEAMAGTVDAPAERPAVPAAA